MIRHEGDGEDVKHREDVLCLQSVVLHDASKVVDQKLHERLDVHAVQAVQSGAEFELVAQILPGLLHPHHHLHRGDGLVQGQVTAGARGVQGVGHHLEILVVVQLGKQRARAGDGAGDQVGEPQSHPG